MYSDIYGHNDADSHDILKREFDSVFPSYYNGRVHESISQFLFTWRDMMDMFSKLKAGKSYAGFVRAEHILHGSPKLAVHLHLLYNTMLQHSYIPTQLLRGTISPLIKDRDGNLSD